MLLSAAEFDVLTERARFVNLVADVIADIATDPTDRNVVYAASKYGGLWRSADGAQPWKLPALADEWITSVLVHPTIPTILYILLHNAGVMKSNDGGTSFVSLGPTSCEFPTGLAIDP